MINPSRVFHIPTGSHEDIFYQSGATKTRATAACQFAIVTWHPDAIVNLGTCGGVSNKLKKRDIILVNKTVHYDCITRFGPIPKGFYKPMTTKLDTSWVDASKVSTKLNKGIIATADQDLDYKCRELLKQKNILGADWESGAISKVCELNKMKCLILRGVTDIPEEQISPDQDIQGADYKENTPKIMKDLIEILSQISFRLNILSTGKKIF